MNDHGVNSMGLEESLALVIMIVGAAGLWAWVRWRVRTEKPAEPGALVVRPEGVTSGDCAGPGEVWHVVDNSYPRNRNAAGPYFIAHCACDWVGGAHPADNAAACKMATVDAYRHSANILPNVTRPLG